MKEVTWKPEEKQKIQCALFFMFFGLMWLLAFFNYISNYVCLVAASSYYFNSNQSAEGDAEVMLGVKFAHF